MCHLCNHGPTPTPSDFIVAEPYIFVRAITHQAEAGLTTEQVTQLMQILRDYQDELFRLLKEVREVRRRLRSLLHRHDFPGQAETIVSDMDRLTDYLKQINRLFLDHILRGMRVFSEEQARIINAIGAEQLAGLEEA